MAKQSPVDEYLATVTGERRRALDELRATIRARLPRAEECISYRLPAFRLDGVVVAGFAATRAGCSYYPFSGATLQSLGDEVAGYTKTKGALHFDAKSGLPTALVHRLLDVRIAEGARSPRRAKGSSSATALDRLRRVCLAQPGAVEKLSHGEPTWFTGAKGKVFAMFDNHHHGAARISVHLPAPDGLQATLVENEPDRYWVPPYVGHRGWVGVFLDGKVDWAMVEELVGEAYRLVAPPPKSGGSKSPAGRAPRTRGLR